MQFECIEEWNYCVESSGAELHEVLGWPFEMLLFNRLGALFGLLMAADRPATNVCMGIVFNILFLMLVEQLPPATVIKKGCKPVISKLFTD